MPSRSWINRLRPAAARVSDYRNLRNILQPAGATISQSARGPRVSLLLPTGEARRSTGNSIARALIGDGSSLCGDPARAGCLTGLTAPTTLNGRCDLVPGKRTRCPSPCNTGTNRQHQRDPCPTGAPSPRLRSPTYGGSQIASASRWCSSRTAPIRSNQYTSGTTSMTNGQPARSRVFQHQLIGHAQFNLGERVPWNSMPTPPTPGNQTNYPCQLGEITQSLRCYLWITRPILR